MRRIILALVATFALFSAVSLSSNRAEAAAMPVGNGIQTAIQDGGLLQDVAYVCRRVWRCGPYGCGWRRVCGYTGPRYYRPYGYYRPHYRPYRYYRW
ncbi:MAG: hypothetical protein AB7K04_11580 [Pseudorhodoplanes sp.]